MIFGPDEAHSVYTAMVHLNNVGARLRATIDSGRQTIIVEQYEDGSVKVTDYTTVMAGTAPRAIHETYDSQAAFAAAYSQE